MKTHTSLEDHIRPGVFFKALSSPFALGVVGAGRRGLGAWAPCGATTGIPPGPPAWEMHEDTAGRRCHSSAPSPPPSGRPPGWAPGSPARGGAGRGRLGVGSSGFQNPRSTLGASWRPSEQQTGVLGSPEQVTGSGCPTQEREARGPPAGLAWGREQTRSPPSEEAPGVCVRGPPAPALGARSVISAWAMAMGHVKVPRARNSLSPARRIAQSTSPRSGAAIPDPQKAVNFLVPPPGKRNGAQPASRAVGGISNPSGPVLVSPVKWASGWRLDPWS